MSASIRAWPFVGHLPAFRADVPGFLLQLAREHGDVARFRLGSRPAFLFAHPSDIKTILVDHAPAFVKGALMQRARRVLGDGLLTSEGAFHREQRRRIQPVFAKEQMQRYAWCIAPAVAQQTRTWRDGRRVRVDHAMDALAMNIVARALLGADIDQRVPAITGALRTLARWAPLLAAPGGKLFEQTRLPFFGQLRSAIEFVETTIDAEIAHNTSPLLSALKDVAGDLTLQQVRDEVMTIFLAGHDTTAAGLTWTWLLLSQHPHVRFALEAEVASVGAQEELTQEVMAQLPLTNMVVQEALRLYPPISRIGRRPLHDLAVAGVEIPAGAAVFVSPYVTHRDVRWFDQPLEFRPARWADDVSGKPRFAWFPFGAGPRSCIGEQFARMTMALVIANVARAWRLNATVSTLPKPRSLLTLKPRGSIWMTASKFPT